MSNPSICIKKLNKNINKNIILTAFNKHNFGKIKNAIHLFENSIKTDDHYSDPYFNLGNIYIQKNDFVKSENLYV